MSTLPWYAHNLEKYSRKTAHLTMLEHGAYRLMLDHYYNTAAPLPAKLEQLHRICRAVAEQEQQAVSSVLAQFFILGDDGWHNETADEELEKMAQISKKRSNSAKKRHATPAVAPANEDANGDTSAGANASANADTLNTNTKHSSLRSEPMPIEKVCRAFGINLTDDVRRLDWPGQLGEMLSGGLSLEADIIPACREARKRKIINLQWVRKRAESEKARRGIAAQPIAASFENTDERGWRDRVRVFRDKGMWSPKFGPKPGEPGCKCPPEILGQDAAA